MRVLVTGATGFVGERLVPALVDAGHDVVALVRDPASYDAPRGVTVAAVDLLEAEAGTTAGDELRAALDVDAAYYLVHSMGEGDDFQEKDRRCAPPSNSPQATPGSRAWSTSAASATTPTNSPNTSGRGGRWSVCSPRERTA